MQIPLLVFRCSSTNSGSNTGAWALNLDFEVNSPTWGRVKDEKWTRENIGNVWIARQDKKDLTVQQVEALTAFCSGPLHDVLIRDVFVREMEMSEIALYKERKRVLLEHACKEKFEIFFDRTKAEKIKKGNQAWKDAVSLYSVS
ncbi:hypothetical protein BDZ45DRAFT_592378 [Acephala macrosclerotiorum]|nr:hypothetical protein BDZ45DRAFT_592378 [Acephala macrosclerotiorum]